MSTDPDEEFVGLLDKYKSDTLVRCMPHDRFIEKSI